MVCIHCNGDDIDQELHIKIGSIFLNRVFCSIECCLSFCKYRIGLLGLEQQANYLYENFNIDITKIEIPKPTIKYKPYILKEYCESISEEKPELMKTESIYDKFLETKIGHQVSHDAFSLDSLLK